MKIDNTKNRGEQVQYDESDLDDTAELDLTRIKSTSWIVTATTANGVKFVGVDEDFSPHFPPTLVLAGNVGSMFNGENGVRVSSVLPGSQMAALLSALSTKMNVSVDMNKDHTSVQMQFYTATIAAKPEGKAADKEQETEA